MRITTETEVAAPPDRVWAALLDLPRVAAALPGATIAAEGIDGAHRTTLRAGAREYAGNLRLQDFDEDERVATFYAQGNATRGVGTAAATVTARVSEGDGVTRVALDADVRVSGGAVHPEAVAAVLAELAAGLEREAPAPAATPLAATPPAATAPLATAPLATAPPATEPLATAPLATAPPATEPLAAPLPAPLETRGAARPRLPERATLLAAGLVVGLLLGRAVRRR
jgi:carbon monoxide dehydrogenase subunit G